MSETTLAIELPGNDDLVVRRTTTQAVHSIKVSGHGVEVRTLLVIGWASHGLLGCQRPSMQPSSVYSAGERRSEVAGPIWGDPLKKLLAGAACVAAVLTGVQGTGWAAPSNGHNTETLVFQCADDSVRVIIKPDSGASGWDVDVQEQLTGVRYFVTSLHARFYLGELTTEPTDVDPLFTTAKEWGNRTGHEETILCFATETFGEGSQVFTGFFDLTATQQDKGN